jgi:NAD-dependent dihydropyrimidine dehydrogenase PreA subunit
VVLARVDKVHAERSDPGAFAVVAGSERAVGADQLVVAIGQGPELGALDGVSLARAARGGGLAVDEGGRSSHERVFAAGDLVEHDRTVTSAIASGRRAAWGVDRALRGFAEAMRRPPPPRPPADAVSSSFMPRRSDVGGRDRGGRDRGGRARPVELAPAERVRGFDEVVARLDEDAARREAERCMVCGKCGNCAVCVEVVGCPAFYVEGGIHIDRALCIDCRVCVSTCPNGAIA